MLMHEMDSYTRHLYQKLLPQVAKITYHDMQIPPQLITDVDLQNITYQLCEGPSKNNLDFWGYVSVVNQMEKNADWHDIHDAIRRSIAEYMEKQSVVIK